jgi:hypothetical protein
MTDSTVLCKVPDWKASSRRRLELAKVDSKEEEICAGLL